MRIPWETPRQHKETKCQLSDGSIHVYDACGDNVDDYDPKNFELIGKGVFYSYGDTLQNIPLADSTKHEYFFRKLF